MVDRGLPWSSSSPKSCFDGFAVPCFLFEESSKLMHLQNLPKAGKKKAVTLGVAEKLLAGSIKAAFPNLQCETSETSEVVADLLRGKLLFPDVT
jgi:hypothetical protein